MVDRTRLPQLIVLALAILYGVAWISANLDCAPKYYARADFLLGVYILGLAVVALFIGVTGDGSERRLSGIVGASLLAGLWAQPDFTLLAVPLAVFACLRLPASRSLLPLAAALAFSGVLVGYGLPLLGGFTMSSSQFLCP